MIDTLEDAAAAAWVITSGLLGRLARTLLPAAVLEALPDFLAGHLRHEVAGMTLSSTVK